MSPYVKVRDVAPGALVVDWQYAVSKTAPSLATLEAGPLTKRWAIGFAARKLVTMATCPPSASQLDWSVHFCYQNELFLKPHIYF